jgi:hypothetical protein
MTHPGYTVLGWIVWRIGRRVARRKLAENRVKVGVAAALALGVVAVVVAARSGSDDSQA